MAAWQINPHVAERCYQLWGLCDAGDYIKLHVALLCKIIQSTSAVFIHIDDHDDGDGISKHCTDVWHWLIKTISLNFKKSHGKGHSQRIRCCPNDKMNMLNTSYKQTSSILFISVLKDAFCSLCCNDDLRKSAVDAIWVRLNVWLF